MYKITYKMEVGWSVHYARDTASALTFVQDTRAAGGSVLGIEDRKGNALTSETLQARLSQNQFPNQSGRSVSGRT